MSDIAGQRERTAEQIAKDVAQAWAHPSPYTAIKMAYDSVTEALLGELRDAGLLRDSGSGEPLTQRVIDAIAILEAHDDRDLLPEETMADAIEALRAALSDRERDTTRNEDAAP